MTKHCLDPKMYGMVTVNAKGQIVIPAEARHHLSIKEGDQFLIVSKDNFTLGLIKADTLQEFILAAQQEHPEMFEQLAQLGTYVKKK